ncbi:hypothetical protein [Cupriavidus sp. DF5525]|uniref:hypothetical protein n=1 Tax=Cupriavidus sp. DF5525 TaxID=3160989 RepID=UPI0032DF78A6
MAAISEIAVVQNLLSIDAYCLYCLGLFDACPWLQNSRRMRAGVEQTSREETAESGDAGDAGYGD